MTAPYVIDTRQTLAIDLSTAWDFFSDPNNLKNITPPSLGFVIINEPAEAMYAGMIISYRVTPLLGIPMTWVSEITHIDDKKLFIDEQRAGPYKMWHHEHHFKETERGTEVRDIIHYILPLGVLGKIAHAAYVKRQLQYIFDYRSRVLQERFS